MCGDEAVPTSSVAILNEDGLDDADLDQVLRPEGTRFRPGGLEAAAEDLERGTVDPAWEQEIDELVAIVLRLDAGSGGP
ncbi:MAG TPA: hypothetical protein VD994_00190 [Prosthecobacter sp.]|nr:hypothetical protein [Prosthecobacter sp.]